MTIEQILGYIFGGSGILALLFAYLKSRGENKNKAAEVYSAAEDMVAKRVKADLADAYSRLDSLDAKMTDLEDRHRVDRRQKAEMIRHIIALESLIPNPPGPPARPEWKTETE